MRSIKVSRRIPTAPAKVWAVLADFPNIATWNTGVSKSFATSDSTGGVGAQRHCDLAPFGELEETVKEWDDTRRMVISIDSAKGSLVRALCSLRAPFSGQNPCALYGRFLNQDTHLRVAWLHVDVHAVVQQRLAADGTYRGNHDVDEGRS